MSSRFSIARTVRFSSKLLITAAAAATLAACSDSLERFASYGSNNPSNADPVYTATVPKAKKLAPAVSDDNEITSTPLKSASLNKSKPVYDYSQDYKKAAAKPKLQLDQEAVSAPVEDLTSGGQDVTNDVAMDDAAVQQPVIQKKKMKSQAGAKVKVAPGMTLYSIARANDVSVKSIARANRLRAPYTLMVGQTLVIPGASHAVTPEVQSAQVDDAPVMKKSGIKGSTYTVAAGDTLYSIGRRSGVSPLIIADANGLKKNSTLSIGQTLRIPGAKVAGAEQPVAAEQPAEQTADAGTSEPAIGETNDKPAVVAESKPAQQLEPIAKPVEAQAPAAGGLAMRWPAQGKVISEFGAKPGGTKNEGINIAVPEGTPIKAAESGVVAYAGNELKGYGNLILIRHEGGYVTAYAHASELSVKRGDTVKRGDVIARAGQTGAVTTPQLHFEVRKGATAMDPLAFLGKSTASN